MTAATILIIYIATIFIANGIAFFCIEVHQNEVSKAINRQIRSRKLIRIPLDEDKRNKNSMYKYNRVPVHVVKFMIPFWNLGEALKKIESRTSIEDAIEEMIVDGRLGFWPTDNMEEEKSVIQSLFNVEEKKEEVSPYKARVADVNSINDLYNNKSQTSEEYAGLKEKTVEQKPIENKVITFSAAKELKVKTKFVKDEKLGSRKNDKGKLVEFKHPKPYLAESSKVTRNKEIEEANKNLEEVLENLDPEVLRAIADKALNLALVKTKNSKNVKIA